MRVLFCGDVSPTVDNEALFALSDTKALFCDTAELFAASDVSIVNLECALTESEEPILKIGPPLKAPPATAKTLAEVGITHCALANNHFFDYGCTGALDTIRALEKVGIGYTGFGANEADSRRDLVIRRDGETLCVIAVCEHEYSYALEDRMGCRPFDEFETPLEIRQAKEHCDRVVVLYHGGKEHCRFPSPRLRKACHAMAKSGAEFYGALDGKKPHLTALDYDMDDPGIRSLIKERCDNMREYTRKCVELGIRLGHIHDLTWNDVLDLNPDGAWLCIDSVMRAMRLKKLVPDDYDWTAFRTNVFRTPEAKRFHPEPPTAERVIKTVRKAGGVIALAHPRGLVSLVEKLVGYGLNGIEVCHPNLSEEESALAMQAAQTFQLYRCGGTDHTGPMSGNGGKYAIPAFQGVTEEEFYTIKERRLG